MKKKNILSLTVLSSLMAIAGFSSFNRVSADSVGVHAETRLKDEKPAIAINEDKTVRLKMFFFFM